MLMPIIIWFWYIKNNEIEKAQQYLNKILAINPEYYQAYYTRAMIFYDKGEILKAKEGLQKVV